MNFPVKTVAQIRAALLQGREIALLDVREEHAHAQAHPLFAANLPWGRLEVDAYAKLPRRNVFIVVFDDGEGHALAAARRLQELGYSDVNVLDGGLAGWRAAGAELFCDVNVPSKAFGELVESERHTPSLSAEQVKALIEQEEDIVIVDARRFDEFQTMSIPTAVSVPGAELVLRVPQLAPRAHTRVIVNCAGRTRSIIGTQSLINAGLPNAVAALRNGTIGWTLAGQTLDHGRQLRHGSTPEVDRVRAAAAARRVADRAGVGRATAANLAAWQQDSERTTYRFDVRTTEEYASAHVSGFRPVPGGQLVQETDMYAPVRGARIVLFDDDGVRANMTASWLAQMAWEVHVLDGLSAQELDACGPWHPPQAVAPGTRSIGTQVLAQWLAQPGTVIVVDVTDSASFIRGHIPGAWFALRSQLEASLATLPSARNFVLTCRTSALAHFVAPELEQLVKEPVWVLEGGNRAWQLAGNVLESGHANMASPPIDRYRRPYEGTDNPRTALQAYLDWEYGLVAQLARDGTHGFRVI